MKKTLSNISELLYNNAPIEIKVMLLLKLSCLLFLSIGLTACVTTQTPKISHVHIGHAMTAWRNTPNEQGLFITAEQEAVIAAEHAQYAIENSHDLNLLKMHIKHVQHAMDPNIAKQGPGLGYGFIKALNAARDHILFAADSSDASENIKSSAQLWSTSVDIIIKRSYLVLALCKGVLESDSHEEVMVLADEIQLLTQQNLYGYDSDADGTIGNIKADYGIKQLKGEILAMIEKEEPPYQTVDKKYLFGLIRLPSGVWMFDFDLQPGTGTDVLEY
ncbi:MAG: hypothetical protein QNL62_09020 [Gammaproteobacteria bacterium]|nr:hypothetical protein [Gammaproteobacteria bacterium]